MKTDSHMCLHMELPLAQEGIRDLFHGMMISIFPCQERTTLFIKLMKGKKDENFLFSTRIMKRYFLVYPKVRKENTVFREKIVDGIYEDNGFIDIFPVDFVDDANIKKMRFLYQRVRFYIHMLKFIECKPYYKEISGEVKYIFDCILSIPFRFMRREQLVTKINRLMSGNGSEETSGYTLEFDYPDQIIKKDVFFPPVKMEFEGTMYYVPNRRVFIVEIRKRFVLLGS